MANDIEFTLTGVDRLVERLAQVAVAIPSAVATALNEVAEVTMTDAKERTPVHYGILRDSGKVSQHASPENIEAKLTFGTEYALAVHEHLSEHSPRSWKTAESTGSGVHFHPGGTGPKFLENAVNKTAGSLVADVAAKVKQILGL